MQKIADSRDDIQASCLRAQTRLLRISRNYGRSGSDVSEAMGCGTGYLSNNDDFRLSRILEALEVTGASPRSFFEGAFVQRADPRDELLMERGHPPGKPHSFLAKVAELVEAWRDQAADPDAPLPVSYRCEVERLEELRYYDHAAAREGFERLIDQLANLAPPPKPLPPRVLAEMAAALTGWAATQRMKGQPDVAGDALSIAFTLAERSGDFWARGMCYRRGAVLMLEYGRPDLGLQWVDEAASALAAAGLFMAQLEMLSDRGVQLFGLGSWSEAERYFRVALRQIPAGSFRYHASAHVGLARLAQRAGQKDDELHHLHAALACFPRPDYHYGHTLWGLGHAQLEQGQELPGRAALKKALNLMQRHGSYYDVARLTLDYANYALAGGHSSELTWLASDIRPWLGGIGRERLIRQFFGELLALIEMGELSDQKLSELSVSLAAAQAYARKNPR